MCASSVLVVVLCVGLGGVRGEGGPVVSTIYGDVEGKVLDSGHRVFLGIPFASPPLANLRFAMPQSPEPWSETRKVVEMPPRCIQMDMGFEFDFFETPPAGDSEDCLYLNVYTPPSGSLDKPLPVMLFIHGGGFNLGSATEHGVQGIADNVLSRGVIVVVIQYRLGFLGLLATSDGTVTGNFGLWDQVESLKWVQANIREFGGDPDSVTIFGESAGAFSVSLLSYAPAAQDLFHKAIMMSGSAHSFGIVSDMSSKAFSPFAEALGCALTDTKQSVDCLRRKPVAELLEVNRDIFGFGQYTKGGEQMDKLPFSWSPTIDGYLLPDSLATLASSLQPKPTMLGTTDLEMVNLIMPPPIYGNYINSTSPLLFPTNADPMEFFTGITQVLVPEPNYHQPQLIRDLVSFYYLHSQAGTTSNRTFVKRQYLEFFNDMWMHTPVIKEAVEKVKVGAPVWMYSFDHYNNQLYPHNYPWKGGHHGTDLVYIFQSQYRIFDFVWTEMDRYVSNSIAQKFTDFAKFGNPNGECGDACGAWSAVESIEDSPTFHFGMEEVRASFHLPSNLFWNQIVPAVDAALRPSPSTQPPTASTPTQEL